MITARGNQERLFSLVTHYVLLLDQALFYGYVIRVRSVPQVSSCSCVRGDFLFIFSFDPETSERVKTKLYDSIVMYFKKVSVSALVHNSLYSFSTTYRH